KRLLREWINAGAPWTRESLVAPAAAAAGARETWVRRLTVPEYNETVRGAVGVDIEQDARRLLPPDLRADGFSNTAYNLQVDLRHVEAYTELAEIVVGRMDVVAFASQFHKRRQLDGDAIRELVAGMGAWVLRGPLDDREIASFAELSQEVAEEGGDYREAVSYILQAMLQSPRFLYRMERQREPGERVGGYELASRLSYIVWGAPPDRELLRAAGASELDDPRRVEEQVKRMLQDPRAIETSSRFIAEWLNLGRLANLRPDPKRFPNWSEALAGDMREETLAFFQRVAWEEQRPLSDLLNAQVTFLTPRLAEHYRLPQKAVVASEAAENRDTETPDRVTSGLQVLYTFQEGAGDTVRDVSGAKDPLHLKIENPAVVGWDPDGLTVRGATLIASRGPARRLTEAVRRSKAVTLEAWVTPANATQAGPARIVTLSSNTAARNFTLGQEGDKYDVRFRTTATDGNGIPSLSGPSSSVQPRPTHMVYTRDASGKATLYIDGDERDSRDVRGDVSNWDANFRLALANEITGDRAWQGTLHLVAVYDRALSLPEVRRNQAAGKTRGQSTSPNFAAAGLERLNDVQALYTFDGGGDTVRDVSGAGDPLNLKIEDASAVDWTGDGLRVKSATLIAAAEPPRRLIEAIKKSNGVTIEAWITPDNPKQSGPARIVTLSSGTNERNFTFGQDGGKFDVRFRATRTSGNGMPSVSSPGGAVQTRPTHVVYTRDATGRAKLYIDGMQAAAGNIDGSLANWQDGFRLALANETTKDRPWLGVLHLVAIYSRALAPQEVRSRSELPARGGLERYDLSSVPHRGGLLTQGSVLTVGGDDGSMVTRGLFIFRNLLAGHIDDPPPCVDTTPVPTRPGESQRGIAEGRIANRACTGCHGIFEPPAFALEKFDGLGAFHEVDEHGNKLREDGEIVFPGRDKPIAFETTAELMDLLAGSDRVKMNITKKVAQFALGRPLVEADEPIIAEIHQAAQKNGGTYASLITALAMSDLVQRHIAH
ncbi:MAG: DUF1592 domain-containing protein, partial [Planctomycetes bacterium]|nr:DUF1592 domain-containing protein [Planctomycetota bacterium]